MSNHDPSPSSCTRFPLRTSVPAPSIGEVGKSSYEYFYNTSGNKYYLYDCQLSINILELVENFWNFWENCENVLKSWENCKKVIIKF